MTAPLSTNTDFSCSLVACVLYWAFWMYGLPRLGKYRIRQETLILDNDVLTHKLVKVPVSQLEKWDETHDAAGRTVDVRVSDTPNNPQSGVNSFEKS